MSVRFEIDRRRRDCEEAKRRTRRGPAGMCLDSADRTIQRLNRTTYREGEIEREIRRTADISCSVSLLPAPAFRPTYFAPALSFTQTQQRRSVHPHSLISSSRFGLTMERDGLDVVQICCYDDQDDRSRGLQALERPEESPTGLAPFHNLRTSGTTRPFVLQIQVDPRGFLSVC